MGIIGIDLGTTNSLVAHINGDTVKLIPNVYGDVLTPSVVSLDEGNHILVGKPAKNRLITHPQLSKACFKRDMGSDRTYDLGGQPFTPLELSSLLLRSLREDAERYLTEKITEAIISVPAYFNEEQRKHTLKAAQMAGIHVERIINEPTAAALSYGIHAMENNSINVILDLGGGTFDVTIMEYFEGIMEVRATGGNSMLGGEDFTALLIEDFIDKYPNVSLSTTDENRLYDCIENAKKAMLTNGELFIEIEIDGRVLHYSCTADTFVQIVNPLLQKIRKTIERCVRDASIDTVEIDRIILVGGASRMQCFMEFITKMFGLELLSSLNPDEVVAMGAAIQAGLKMRNKALKDIILTDVAPHTLGIETTQSNRNGGYKEGYYSPIIDRNTTIPVSRIQKFTTAQLGQKEIEVNVFQGESRLVDNNNPLGVVSIEVPYNKKKHEEIDVRFTYDVNGLLEVEVVVCTTGKKKTMVIEKNPGTISKEMVAQQLERLEGLKIHPVDKQVNKELISRVERVYYEVNGDIRDLIQHEAAQFEIALDTQDDKIIRTAYKKLNDFIAEYWIGSDE